MAVDDLILIFLQRRPKFPIPARSDLLELCGERVDPAADIGIEARKFLALLIRQGGYRSRNPRNLSAYGFRELAFFRPFLCRRGSHTTGDLLQAVLESRVDIAQLLFFICL